MRSAWLLLVGCIAGCNNGGPSTTNLTGNNTFLADPSGAEPDATPTGAGTDTGGTQDPDTTASPTSVGETGPDATSTPSGPTSDPDTTDPTRDPDTTDPTNDPDTTDPTNDPDTTDPTNDPDTTDTGDGPATLEEAIQTFCDRYTFCYAFNPWPNAMECYIEVKDGSDDFMQTASDKAACEAALFEYYVCREEVLCGDQYGQVCSPDPIYAACF